VAKRPEKSSAGGGAHEEMVRSLARLLDETSLSEIEVERGGMRVRVARHSSPMAASAMYAAPAFSSAPGTMPSDPAAIVAPAPSRTNDPASHPGVVTSPMVGTAYRASQPGAKPFVDVGSVVKAGDTLLIIEAMKTMNQIPAPRGGTVTQILFEDAQPVEYGEPLIIVE
jgi:acetyl-CoA carboxylase biotin carboxyl carrier protein